MARLTYKARKRMGRKQFATAPTRSAKKRGMKGSFPTDTSGRARNALSRVSHKSPAMKAKVRAAVHRAFPSIKIGKGKK